MTKVVTTVAACSYCCSLLTITLALIDTLGTQSWVSLIAGLKYGMERWGEWNKMVFVNVHSDL